jgi:hypothetical protein
MAKDSFLEQEVQLIVVWSEEMTSADNYYSRSTRCAAKDITLTGQNFETSNLLTAEPKDNATTGAFVPFTTTTQAGQVVKGQFKCNSCIQVLIWMERI